jgi:hypothetical protein
MSVKEIFDRINETVGFYVGYVIRLPHYYYNQPCHPPGHDGAGSLILRIERFNKVYYDTSLRI